MAIISTDVVIVGAGWLGNALANTLINNNNRVVRTSRKAQNESTWAQFNLEKGICDINSRDAIWFFCIPPGRTKEAQSDYEHYLSESLKLAQNQQARRFIFCSSSGVYPNDSKRFDETCSFDVSSTKQLRLIAHERTVMQSPLASIIVRLGGLFGKNRHPGRFLSGKTLSSSGLASVNMIHQSDAVNGLIFLAEKKTINEPIINLVTPHHPTKEAFYNKASKVLEMPAPNFVKDDKQQRIISSDLIVSLGFKFKYADLFDALLDC